MTSNFKEFETLREEVREWQQRRFSLLSVVAIFVTGFIGWVVDKPKEWAWDVASLPVLLLVSGACILTGHFSRLIVRASTYLEVFHEFKWQTQLDSFRKAEKPQKTNLIVSAFYLGVTLIALVTFITVCQSMGNFATKSIFVIFCFSMCASLFFLAFKSSPHSLYLKQWRYIKSVEQAAQQAAQEGPPPSSAAP